MSRPQRTFKSMLRRLEMTHEDLCIFVEGRLDLAVVQRVAASHGQLSEFAATVFRSDEIEAEDESQGKWLLLELHDYLKSAERLARVNSRNSTVLFCVDKDQDDILRKRHDSRYVLYTAAYNMEAEIFYQSLSVDLVAASLQLKLSEVPHYCGSGKEAIAHIAKRIERWIIFCLLCARTSANVSARNFGREWPLQCSFDLAIDHCGFDGLEQSLLRPLAEDNAAMNRHREAATLRLRRLEQRGLLCRLINGRLLLQALSHLVLNTTDRKAAKAASERLLGALTTNFPPEGPFGQRIASRVHELRTS